MGGVTIIIAIFVCLSVFFAVLVKRSLFSSKFKAENEKVQNKFFKSLSVIIRALAVVFTAIVSFILLVVLSVMALFSSGGVGTSTYGTPIHRPRII